MAAVRAASMIAGGLSDPRLAPLFPAAIRGGVDRPCARPSPASPACGEGEPAIRYGTWITGTLCTGSTPGRGRWMVFPLTWTVNWEAPITVARMRWPGSISGRPERRRQFAAQRFARVRAISP